MGRGLGLDHVGFGLGFRTGICDWNWAGVETGVTLGIGFGLKLGSKLETECGWGLV